MPAYKNPQGRPYRGRKPFIQRKKRECEKELKIKILDFQFLFFHFFLWNGFHTRSPTFISLLTAAGGKKLVPAVNNMKVYTRE